MKKFISAAILALTLALAIPVKAQEQVTVPKELLTKDQLDQVRQKQIQEKVQSYGKWVGIGHELGTAVNESLTAVTTQANNFAQTPVGKLTAALVIWKVVGHDVMGFIVGSLEIIIILPIWIWSYRKYLPRKIVASETFDPTTHKVTSRTYKVINDPSSKDGDEAGGFCIGHYAMLAVLFIVCMITMWGCN